MPLDFPTSPVDGQVFNNFYWDSSMNAWRSRGSSTPLVPAGVISQYAGSAAPAGYLLCEGQSLLTSNYPALFAAIGYSYGGSGSNFNIPNLKGRIPVGKDTGTFSSLGLTGGAESVTLDSTQIPSHTHPITDPGHYHNTNHAHTVWDHSHGQVITANSGGPGIRWDYRQDGSCYTYPQGVNTSGIGNQATSTENPASDTKYTGITVNGQSGTAGVNFGKSHNNLQPYIVVNYIIKV